MENSKLDKINTFTRRPLREEELYVFPVTLCDNDIDRDGERFSDEALLTMSRLYIGKTGIFDHDPKGDNQTARIFDTEVVVAPEKLTKDGRVYRYLRAEAYMVRTDKNADLITEIDAGIKKEVSVSCSANKRICSVCGADINKEPCEHRKGHLYIGSGEYGKCHVILDDIADAYEWSFVAVPAQINAGVTKKYDLKEEEKTMGNEFTPITTHAELDAKIADAVAAAVAENEKKYEGWSSPEDVAAIAKERDDSKTDADTLGAENKSYKISAMKMKAANEKGIPFELAEKLSGETEEEINRDAESFAKYFNAPKYRPTPRFSGETGMVSGTNAAMLDALREINQN